MNITIDDIKGEKRIDLSYPIYPKKEIAVVSMLSNNAQYWLQGSIENVVHHGQENCAEQRSMYR